MTCRRSIRSGRCSTCATGSPANTPRRHAGGPLDQQRSERRRNEHMAAHAPARQQTEPLSNGMLGFILFIASEVMFFGGLFAAYFIARADSPQWPPTQLFELRQGRPPGWSSTSRSCSRRSRHRRSILSSVDDAVGASFQIRKGNRTGARMGVVHQHDAGPYLPRDADVRLLAAAVPGERHDLRDDVLHAHRLPRGARGGRRHLHDGVPGACRWADSSRPSITRRSKRRRSTGTSSTWSGSSLFTVLYIVPT